VPRMRHHPCLPQSCPAAWQGIEKLSRRAGPSRGTHWNTRPQAACTDAGTAAHASLIAVLRLGKAMDCAQLGLRKAAAVLTIQSLFLSILFCRSARCICSRVKYSTNSARPLMSSFSSA
jgi:hypothetical protein